MSLYDKLGGGRPAVSPQQNQPQNAQEALNRAVETAKANYSAMLQQRGFTVPEGMTDPQQMVQHLVQSGQVPQNLYQAAIQRVFGGRR